MDATISTFAKMVGLAAIFRVNKRVQAVLSKPLKGTLSIFQAESLAILVRLRWAQTIGLPIKMVLSDSLSLVQALNSTNSYHNELGMIFHDIRVLLSNFSGASVSYVSRKFNTEAHKLAREALQLEEKLLWMDTNN